MRPPDPLVGRLFDDRYEVLSRIGEGGMGAVYKARQIAMDRMVALKVVHPQQQIDEVVLKRFEREMRTSSKLAHPNVIRVYDWGKAPDGAFYLAMELLDGESLDERLKRGAMPLDRALHVATQILKALAAAHAQQIVHRDLKPDNIMLCRVVGEPDQVRVLDFGIATFAPGSEEPSARITASGILVGTPSYVSPEQIGGEPVDQRSDLYCFGVVLYEMVTGQLPFADPARPLRVLQMHMTEAPKPPSTVAAQPIPEWLDELVLQLLAKYPDDRPRTADEVLARIEARTKTSATPPPVLERPKSLMPDERPVQTSPLLIGAGVLVVALAFGLGGLLFGVLLSG